jgi:ribonucleoside-diphosphate reductase alpha chain
LKFNRLFTEENVNYFETKAYSEINGKYLPIDWDNTARQIFSSKYMWESETHIRETIDRVVGTIMNFGISAGYFDTWDDPNSDAGIFYQELSYALLHQYVSFNSPVWFNAGKENGILTACFINEINDSIQSIFDYQALEARIFKNGAGSGTNISKLRGKGERLSKGGNSSGPISFVKGQDVYAGAIRSAGILRRAAKMISLDVDHPDIQEFIDLKVVEENKARALIEAG